MKARLDRETICLRAAKEFFDGSVVNLGGGIPTLCCNFIPEGRTVVFHSENGMLGFGPVVYEDSVQDVCMMNASGQFVQPQAGMCFFDHAMSFTMIRGGHINIAVLGALQVSEKGDLANWLIPERKVGTIGGAMDLAVCCKKIIVTMEHTTRTGEPKIVKRCRYPLTAAECVDLVVTDLAVIEVAKEGLILREIAPGWTIDEVQALTEPKLRPADDLKEITL